MKKHVLALLLAVATTFGVQASNLIISTGKINNIAAEAAGADTLADSYNSDAWTYIDFNVRWNNSWRDNENFDCAWLFVKYYDVDNCRWKHAWLSTTDNDHTITDAGGGTNPAYIQVEMSNVSGAIGDKAMGAIVYRQKEGSGNNNWDVRLRWEYGTEATHFVKLSDVKTVKVFGFEMVYVPTDAFYLGDMNTKSDQGYSNRFQAYYSPWPVRVVSNRPLYCGYKSNTSSKFHWNNNSTPVFDTILYARRHYWTWDNDYRDLGFQDYANHNTNNDNYAFPVNYPKGYNAIYCMKTEVTQNLYCEFLNTLYNLAPEHIRYPNKYGSYRFNIRWSGEKFICDASGRGTGTEVDDGGWVALNWVSYDDMLMFLDWAALRPMTELEYEKICRGPMVPTPREYAWGNNQITLPSGIKNKNTAQEYYGTGNCMYGNTTLVEATDGPTRPGSFAKTANSTRQASGATYYGVFDMSGNVWEMVVSGNIRREQSRTYSQYIHGIGDLDDNDSTTIASWQALSLEMKSTSTDDYGHSIGKRGGAWDTEQSSVLRCDCWDDNTWRDNNERGYLNNLFVSSRGVGTCRRTASLARNRSQGFRGVRTVQATIHPAVR